MVEIQSMVPIAAVVDLVLGIATLSILSRSQGASANNRIVGCVLGWILVFLGLSYIMTSVLEFRYGALEDFSAVDTSKVGGTFAFTAKNLLLSSSYMLMVLLPFFFPFRLINKEWDLWFLLAGVCVASAVFTALHLMTDFKHFPVENFLFIPGYVVLISMYIRFVVTEVRDSDERLRKISVVVGLLLMGIHGETMTYWLSQVLSINDLFFQRQSIQNGLSISGAAWGGINTRLTMGATAMLVLFTGEVWRSFKVGISPFGVLTFVVFIIGFIAGLADVAVLDVVRSCYESQCQSFPAAYSIWYDFTSEALVYLYTPILFMFILLHYDIVDTKREENRWLIRIIVILMLLIVSSTILELIQSFLPIPDMISSAALAIVVGVFIGWEERIVNSLIDDSASVQETVPDFVRPEMDESAASTRLFNLVFGGVTVFILIVSMLFTGLGVLGG
ncbi:MAG: hypothetical protein CMB11_06770 [Euryarchaeota archaeon]|nr:hypothetical protein [Euryarchaeota archaeon]MBD40063.1 hypothetical protein [Euryarchaeota archaeon]|tara:strand:+ start:28 stop:1368 length:1341 start_codon:yes stop_codon:yes gene_type:complete